jgi:hypothetical protein
MSEAPWGHSPRKPVLYRLVKGITIVAVLSGVVVGLHRNDLLREGARRIGREAQYLELERRLVGAPGYGTPRSVEANLHAPPAAAPAAVELAGATPAPSPEPAAAPEPAGAPAPSPAATAAAPTASPEPAALAKVASPPANSTSLAAESVDPLKPISLDQLPVLRSGQSSAKTLAPSAAAPASTPRAAAKVQAFDAGEPKAKPTKPKAEKAEKVEKAAAAPKPAPKVKEPDATAPRSSDNPLKAAIRDAMRKQGVK